MSKTIIDVARHAKVSTATVSRVLNDSNSVKPETRDRVLSAIQHLNYMPNALARGLIAGTTNTIGVIIPDINNIFYPEVVRGICRFLEDNDYVAFLCNTDGNMVSEKRYIQTLLERRVDGIIFLGTRPVDAKQNEHIRKLAETVHVVMINDQLLGSNVYSVLTDEVEGSYKAVSKLIEFGHTEIALVTSYEGFTTYNSKQRGYEVALRDHGIDIDETRIVRDTPYADGGKRATDRLFDKGIHFSAVLAASDQIAMGVIRSILERGHRIPEDFSVVGFSGCSIAPDLYPSLTTVSQFPHKTGEIAAQCVVSLINGERNDNNKTTMITPELILRESIGKKR